MEAATGLGGRADIHREERTRVRLVLEGRGRAKTGGLRGAASRVAVQGGPVGQQSGLSCRGSAVRAGRTGSPGLRFGAVRMSFPPACLGTRGRAAASCLLLLPTGREDSLWLGNRALSRRSLTRALAFSGPGELPEGSRQLVLRRGQQRCLIPRAACQPRVPGLGAVAPGSPSQRAAAQCHLCVPHSGELPPPLPRGPDLLEQPLRGLSLGPGGAGKPGGAAPLARVEGVGSGPLELHLEASLPPCVPSCRTAAFPECVQVCDTFSTFCSPFSSPPSHCHPGGCSSQLSFLCPQQRPSEGVTAAQPPGGPGRVAAPAGAWRWCSFWGVLTSPSLSQVVSQLPVGPESGETLFLAEQPPLPPSLTNGTTVPAAKPLPTLIKVQTDPQPTAPCP